MLTSPGPAPDASRGLRLRRFAGRHRYHAALVGALAVAAFFRFYQLNRLPPGLFPDEAANGISIFQILEHHDFQPIYTNNGPNESLFTFIQAVFVAAMGNTILALRIAPAAFGVAALVPTYLWARRLWGERVAVLSSLYMAITPWAFIINRTGFRANMTPFMVMLTMWLITLAYQTRRMRWFIVSGVSMGVGMYTYLNFKAFPLIPVLLVAAVYWRARPGIGRLWVRVRRPVLATVGAFLLTCSWMIAYGVQHPLDVVGRPAGVSFLTPSINHGQPLQTLVTTIGKTALMFNLFGNPDYKFNLGGAPELPLFIGAAFLIGLVIAVVSIRRLRFLALLTVLAVMLLPEVLSAQGIPHAMRAIGAMPAVLILAALGTDWLLQQWQRRFPIRVAARATALGLLALILAATAYGAYREYFVTWAQSPQAYQAFASDTVAISSYLNAGGFDGTTYVVIGAYADQTVQYLTHGFAVYTRIGASALSSLEVEGPTRIVIDVNQAGAGTSRLRQGFPDAREVAAPAGFDGSHPFTAYVVAG